MSRVTGIFRGAAAIVREWGGFRDYFEDACAKSPINELVDPPFKPSPTFTWTFTPPPSKPITLDNPEDIATFERVDISWMFGR